jgi:hypothetical protein
MRVFFKTHLDANPCTVSCNSMHNPVNQCTVTKNFQTERAATKRPKCAVDELDVGGKGSLSLCHWRGDEYALGSN